MRDNPRYLRFHHHPGIPLPKSGRSRHGITGERHEGVSVFEGELVGEDLFRIRTETLPEETVGLLLIFAASDAAAVFAEGEELAKGPGGEPLLRVSRTQPVPKTTSVTTTEVLTQRALELWSRGPRDGSGGKHVRSRLSAGAGYVDEDVTLNLDAPTPHKLAANKAKKNRRRELQKQARKRNRRRS